MGAVSRAGYAFLMMMALYQVSLSLGDGLNRWGWIALDLLGCAFWLYRACLEKEE